MDLVYKRGYRRICVLEKGRSVANRSASLDSTTFLIMLQTANHINQAEMRSLPRRRLFVWSNGSEIQTATRQATDAIITPHCLRNFLPKMCNATTLKVRSQRFSYENLKKNLAFALNSQKPLKKQRKFMQSLTRRERLQSRRTHAGKKKFFLWKNMMRTLENRNRSSVSARPHLLTERRESALKQFDYREVITPPPISLLYSPSTPLCCTHRPNSEHDSSLHCHEYQSAGLKDELLLQ